MNGELIWVLSLLAVAIVLFATGRVRMDAVAVFVIFAVGLIGTQPVPPLFCGVCGTNGCCHRKGDMAGHSGGQQ